ATPANSGGGGENCTPDDLLCRQTPCCLGDATSNRQTFWSGVRELHPCFRTGDPGYCSYTNSALERAARVKLASSGWRPEAPAAIPCSLFKNLLAGMTGFEPAKTGFVDQRPSHRVLTPVAVATGVEPVPPDRQSGILPLDSATTSNFGCEGRIRTCMDRFRAGDPIQLNDLATSFRGLRPKDAASPSRKLRARQRSVLAHPRREQSVTVFSGKEK